MTIPVLSQEQFLELLKKAGCKVISDDYWNDYDTLVMQKDDAIFTLTLEKRYFYTQVVIKCKELGIEPPEDHLRQFYQHFHPDDPCFCGKQKKFSECHGKVS
jgi:hypothetical protein